MAKITVRLDADLVIDVLLLAGVRQAQDAVELVLRDYVERAHRTDALTGSSAEERRRSETERRPEG